jgi:tetratricopeptide (TPR) repeat protein
MSLNFKQVSLIAVTVIITIVLFVMGFKTPFGNSQPKGVSVLNASFNIETCLSEQTTKQEEAIKLRLIKLTEDKGNKESLLKLTQLWDSLSVLVGSAYYSKLLAEKENSEILWLNSGSKFYNAGNFSQDSSLVAYCMSNAKDAYSKVLELNSNNLQAKNALAVCIIQGDNDVMKGVAMLKEVVAIDSTNVQAIFTLGMLSIQSNQLEKAKERFEKLVSLEPFNPEYYFYLGEIYAKSGNTKKAINTYETCKTLLTDKEAKKEIDTIINKLNKL